MNDSTRPVFDPEWKLKYRELIATPEQAVARLRPGQRVFIGSGCAQPQTLLHALAARGRELPDMELVQLLSQGDAPHADRSLTDNFRINSLFVSRNIRGLVHEGLADYTPIQLSAIPKLFSSGQLPLDAALIQVTPPDERGMCSFGVSVDIVSSAAENASLVIAEINPNMPRTLGDSMIHVRDLDVIVPVETPIIEFAGTPLDDDTRCIGEFIAALVEDGSTVEFGIGRIPQAVAGLLKDKKDLGIHTEMFTDDLLPLIESGAVTGERKSMDRKRVTASFCLGSRKLYDTIHNNPTFCFRPTEHVNDPFVISRQYKQVAINVAIEIDLTGQICADSIGGQFYSGFGGQVDFNTGAARSHGGKAIIALPSTAKNGTVSRIVTCLTPGAGVVTTRGDAHYVVTEYGVAYLHGKTVQERAIALISIAHPKFRSRLVQEAVDAKYLRPDMKEMSGKMVVGPAEFRATFTLGDGTSISFRPIHPTDEPRMRELFNTLSQETLYYRYMSSIRHVPRREIQNYVFINHRTDVAIVGTIPEASGDEIIAIGRYYLNEKTNFAEVAFVVHDRWQDRGIGTFLLNHLIKIAKRNGISGFTAEVLRANRAMQRVFQKCAHKVTSRPSEDVYSFRIEFT